MRKTLKYRLYPSKAQTDYLDGQLREACRLYNAALEERRGAWRTRRVSVTYYDQANQLKTIRAEGSLELANFLCCQDVLRRLDKTFRAFFRRCKAGETPGYPRFKNPRRFDSITFPTYGDGCRLLENGRLRLQDAGHIKVKWHRPLEGTIKTVTITRQAGKWYACFSVDVEPHPLPFSTREVGLDLGLTTFAALSSGTYIENPRHFASAQAALGVIQRRVARRHRASARRCKSVLLLQKAHAHIRNQRSDFHHKEARKLVNTYGLIAVEDLNVTGLARGMLAKPIADAGWSSFLSKLAYKAAEAGRELRRVNPHGTTQTCLCGTRVSKTLRDRWHVCSVCGLSAPRDIVSAQLVLHRARSGPSGVNVEEPISCVA